MTALYEIALAPEPEADAAPPPLRVEGLTKRFGGLTAVKNIGFSIRSGEIMGLIGPNGSGKSTVMKLILGIERPDAGSVRIGGVDVVGWPAHRIARQGVGMVFQHSRPLHRQTVLENIKLALLPDKLLQRPANREITERAEAIARDVGLYEMRHRYPATLDYACLRRIELAKALARAPRVVLVDEPFAGLTASEIDAFSQLIAGFSEQGNAVLLVDHNVKSMSSLADRVFAMHHGECIAEGTVDEVTHDPTVRRVYLGGGLSVADRPATHTQPLLRVAALDVHYDKAQALAGVSLEVRAGEFVSIVGHNGAGKTSLFNAISGLVPYGGSIALDGADLRRKSPASIARAGIVQCPETRELFGTLCVRENLDLAGRWLPAREVARQLDWIYELFPRLNDRGKQLAQTLSGGEQQMLAIARALMMRPRLLILDEPTLGLAPVVIGQISHALERLQRQGDITVLLGEQNVTFALPHADRVYVLDHARIVWEGKPSRFEAEAGQDYL